jgi:hypothetical protein
MLPCFTERVGPPGMMMTGRASLPFVAEERG